MKTQEKVNKGDKTGLQPVSKPVEQVPWVKPVYWNTVIRKKMVELGQALCNEKTFVHPLTSRKRKEEKRQTY